MQPACFCRRNFLELWKLTGVIRNEEKVVVSVTRKTLNTFMKLSEKEVNKIIIFKKVLKSLVLSITLPIRVLFHVTIMPRQSFGIFLIFLYKCRNLDYLMLAPYPPTEKH